MNNPMGRTFTPWPDHEALQSKEIRASTAFCHAVSQAARWAIYPTSTSLTYSHITLWDPVIVGFCSDYTLPTYFFRVPYMCRAESPTHRWTKEIYINTELGACLQPGKGNGWLVRDMFDNTKVVLPRFMWSGGLLAFDEYRTAIL